MNQPACRLLVVDDNEMNRDMLARRLQKQGYAVETAADGFQVIELVGTQAFDLILLDIMMPRLTGLEALRTLRERYSPTDLPIIMVSAKDESADVVQALELGANDYVTKPIDFPVVLARVQSQLRLKRTAKLVHAGAAHLPVAPSLTEIRPGVVLADKYRLESKLGAGGFGVVYRATHVALDHQVAVKVLQSDLVPGSDRSDELARFQLEGISACRVSHPNAVSVLDFSVTTTGVAYLVMELLEGEPLSEELRRQGTLTPMRCAEILLPVCDVLAAAHAAGIIHRDIKPANVFLHRGRGGEIVKVLDFGIAKLVGDARGDQYDTLTLDGTVLGTPAYMAPERLRNLPYDGRADVYSLGVMLYQMLAGHPPFKAQDPVAVAIQQISAQPPRLRDVNSTVPEAVEAVVMQALSKDPRERPAAAALATRFSWALGLDTGGHDRSVVVQPDEPHAETTEHDLLTLAQSILDRSDR